MAHSVDLTFGPGVTQQDVMITIIDDLCLEHNEQFNSFISLTVAADPAITLSPRQASITVFDNDRTLLIQPPSISLSLKAKRLVSMPLTMVHLMSAPEWARSESINYPLG